MHVQHCPYNVGTMYYEQYAYMFISFMEDVTEEHIGTQRQLTQH